MTLFDIPEPVDPSLRAETLRRLAVGLDIPVEILSDEKTRSRFTDDDYREMSQAVAEALSAGLDPHAAAVRTVGFASLRPSETTEIASIVGMHINDRRGDE